MSLSFVEQNMNLFNVEQNNLPGVLEMRCYTNANVQSEQSFKELVDVY
jgi:hypothetical protein